MKLLIDLYAQAGAWSPTTGRPRKARSYCQPAARLALFGFRRNLRVPQAMTLAQWKASSLKTEPARRKIFRSHRQTFHDRVSPPI
jgi:hypothetical protein